MRGRPVAERLHASWARPPSCVHVSLALPRTSSVLVTFATQPKYLSVMAAKVHTPTGYPVLGPKWWEYT